LSYVYSPAKGRPWLCEYRGVLGESHEKLRATEVRLAKLSDATIIQLVREIGAYLSGANLSGADLSVANLSGADLSGAYLSGAYLSVAEKDQSTVFPYGFDLGRLA
jgi:uncharacterized protein YjbI with pentapeptide repeats